MSALKKKTRNIAAIKTLEENRELLDSLTVAQITALESTFLSFSTDVPGFINAKQIGPLLRALGDDPSPSEVAELISKLDASGNGLVDLEEMTALLAIRTKHKHRPDEVKEALKVSRTREVAAWPLGREREGAETGRVGSLEEAPSLAPQRFSPDPSFGLHPPSSFPLQLLAEDLLPASPGSEPSSEPKSISVERFATALGELAGMSEADVKEAVAVASPGGSTGEVDIDALASLLFSM